MVVRVHQHGRGVQRLRVFPRGIAFRHALADHTARPNASTEDEREQRGDLVILVATDVRVVLLALGRRAGELRVAQVIRRAQHQLD